MTKQHFIALADAVRGVEQRVRHNVRAQWGSEQARAEQALKAYRDALADFCQAQNPRFDRARWLAYIAGESAGRASNGGRVKKEGGR